MDDNLDRSPEVMGAIEAAKKDILAKAYLQKMVSNSTAYSTHHDKCHSMINTTFASFKFCNRSWTSGFATSSLTLLFLSDCGRLVLTALRRGFVVFVCGCEEENMPPNDVPDPGPDVGVGSVFEKYGLGWFGWCSGWDGSDCWK